MNKNELIEAVAAQTFAKKADTRIMLDVLLREIRAAVRRGEPVRLGGFGTFEPVHRAARLARNPRTGEPVPMFGRTVPRFRPSPLFREAVETGE